MKTSLADLSRAYQNYLRDNGPGAGASCPPLERLTQCVLAQVSKKERAEIVGHAANCAACSAALRDLLGVSEEVDRFITQAEAVSEHRPESGSQPARVLWARLTRKPAVAVLAGIFAVAVMTFSVFRLLDRSGTRGGAEARILLVSPVKAALSRDSILFRWQSAAKADHYTVELFDKSFQLVWRSDPVQGNEVRPSGGAHMKMIPGETYYWLVTAVTGDHAEMKSRLAEFSVSK